MKLFSKITKGVHIFIWFPISKLMQIYRWYSVEGIVVVNSIFTDFIFTTSTPFLSVTTKYNQTPNKIEQKKKLNFIV